MAYAGPLRGEPLAVELHNTLYAGSGGAVDGLADRASAAAWLAAIDDRLPEGGDGPWPTVEELTDLRAAVGQALRAALAQTAPDENALEAINRASSRAPRSPIAVWAPGGVPVATTDHHGASRADIVIGSLASDAIDLLTGPRRADLRACGGPGCVLLFLKSHPRRAWCSNACGNRARQARHYRRTRQSTRRS